jgi:hypothetical protein
MNLKSPQVRVGKVRMIKKLVVIGLESLLPETQQQILNLVSNTNFIPYKKIWCVFFIWITLPGFDEIQN